MSEWSGYTGTILEIDLTSRKTFSIKENKEDLRQFLGGFGMNCKLFADRFVPKVDPLSPENFVIIGTGPLVGTITPGASRTVVISKFPATGAIANSCGSMSFGFQMKQAGYDHVIIHGRAEKPSYLLIIDDAVEIRDASKIWGKDIVNSTNFLKKKHGSSGVISIGQAGENLVKGALTLIDNTSTLGRGGLGAILGSKNVKAIVVKGKRGIDIAHPTVFNELYEKFMERVRNYPQRESWLSLGMLRSLPIGMLLSLKGQKTKVKQVSERTYLKKIKARRIACPSCPMADKDILLIKEGEFQGLINYTSSVINPFLMFTLEGLKSHDEAIKAFDLINRYGLDSLTITALLEFLTQMQEKGILTEDITGIKFSTDYKSLERLIKMIAFRKGFGNILAEGWEGLAELNEKIREEMLVIKGLDVVFEPRLLRLGTMEFEQVVNPKGAHIASGGSPTYVGAASSIDKFETHFHRMGIPNDAIKRIFNPPKKDLLIDIGRLTRYSEDWYALLTSLGLCARAQMNRFYNFRLIREIYNSVTGFNLSEDEFRRTAERSWNLLKILNMKEGFSRKNDKFPSNWFKPLRYGKLTLEIKDFTGETRITEELAIELLDNYYDERGWDKENGLPTTSKLKQLNLERYLT
ncbi:MAG: aldehyde ferredoxin oxidoreductase N-terminal domain-containing protein [Promethearchaeota archaeon]